MIKKISVVVAFSFAVLLIGGAPAYAGSVIVNTMLDRFGGAVMGLSGLQVQVTYHADVRDLSTGAVLASGSTVPAGTDLLFTCGEHRYEDVYWFSSGYNADSPYGDWVEGAARPEGDLCVEKNYVPFDGRTEGHQGRTYATFSVDPPISSISGLPATCTTHTDGVSKVCRDVQPGTLSGTCSYQTTNGIFYGVNGLLKQGGGYRGASVSATCTNQASPSVSGSVPVPTASLTHTITVSNTPADPTNTPTAPSVTAAGSSCTLETPYTVQMQATDPNGDRIRYGIDWDNNGSVDQFVPPSGYVASGTTQTAARTYTTEGTKTIRIFAQDEGGLTSGSTTFSFDCTAARTDTDDTDETLIITTGDTGDGDTGSGSLVDLSLRAIPSLVPPGERTRVHWSSTNADSCTVTAPNGDTWSTLQSLIGGEISSPITEETIYTLRCLDASGTEYTQTARVNVLPLWSEF